MCGIVGFAGLRPAQKILTDGLSLLEYRGYDSAGTAVIKGQEIKVTKTTERIESLKKATAEDSSGNIGIGHTRWATHGAPSVANAHPHLSGNRKFAVVHNGIIENYAELKQELILEGVCFKSETDTEVIPLLLEKHYNGNLIETLETVLSRLEGSYALGILCTDFPDTLIAAKQISPLIIGIGENENFIASDVTAIVSHTKKIINLSDGEIAFITNKAVKIFDKCGRAKQKDISFIDWDIAAAEKGGYDHFMMKEIMEQPEAVRRTVTSRIRDGKIAFDDLSLNEESLKGFKSIQIIACGSAYHAGVVGKYVFEELLRLPTHVDIASEYRYRSPVTDQDTLSVFISQSGETADTLAALKEAKSLGAHTLAIVNVVGSAIAKAADDVIYTAAGPEIAVATTKGYSAQLAVIYLFAVWAAEKLKSAPENRLNQMFCELVKLPDKIEETLCIWPQAKEAAKERHNMNSMFFIGRNIDYAVSLEAALKLKEISYIGTEAYAAGELKHGTISLIEKGTIVAALCCYERLKDKMLSNVKEVTARGGSIIACTASDIDSEESGIKSLFKIPKTDPLFIASLEIIPFQFYAYYVALFKGCDIDKPRNLAKSVTVE